jgi:excinuclease ABC subunit A
VGLGYIKLGQPATTLSGGEAQRVKLSRELSKRATGRTLYVLDEPSVGLHAADVHKLIEVLQRFADDGNTVLIIEHQPDIIKIADHLIDLGPEGGDRGGYIVAEGTPEEVARVRESYTGQFLKRYLTNGNGKRR